MALGRTIWNAVDVVIGVGLIVSVVLALRTNNPKNAAIYSSNKSALSK
jgi:hypothetical protein